MKMPSIKIDLEKLHTNVKVMTGLCAQYGIHVAGVVKCCCGSPAVAKVMESGGCAQIADSRMENIRKMRDAGILSEIWLLRLPLKSETAQVVKYADLSLNSEPEILQALSEEAVRQDKLHKVLLMVDLGDRREGVLPGEAVDFARYIQKLPGLVLSGIGTNLTCFGGIVPDEHNMEKLASTARRIRQELKISLPYVSAGNSSSIEWMLTGKMPPEINHLRLGESILLGRETCSGNRIPQTYDDAFILRAEVIESAIKPSRTEGKAHLDAFGHAPQIKDCGNHRRLLLGIGREDTVPEGLYPEEPGLQILGASSDHLVADAEYMDFIPQPGDILSFRMNYAALLSGMTSEYVGKEYTGGKTESRYTDRQIIGVPYAADSEGAGTKRGPEALLAAGLVKRLAAGTEPVILDELNDSETTETKVCEACLASYGNGAVPYVIGGDHTVAAGLAKAAVRMHAGCGWIVFSAHGDFHKQVFPGKSAAGTTLSRVIGQGIPPENMVMIGLRALDPDERDFLHSSGIHVFTMEQIDRFGIAEVMERALTALRNVSGVIVDFAANCMDLYDDPDMTEMSSAGLSLREAHCAMEILFDSGLVCGTVWSEFDPGRDTSGIHAKKVNALLASLSGKRIL